MEVPLEAHLIEETVAVSSAEEATQTARFCFRPPTPEYVPAKTGVDAATQIEAEDGLFVFDVEVEPILEVLVSKTLEQGLQEVREEAEIEGLLARKAELNDANAREKERVLMMERKEAARWAAKEERRLAERARVAREAVVSAKVSARAAAAAMIAGAGRGGGEGMAAFLLDKCEVLGHFTDPVRLMVTGEFLPWLLPQAAEAAGRVEAGRQACAGMLQAAVDLAATRRREAAARAEAARAQREAFEAECARKEALAGVINIYIRRPDADPDADPDNPEEQQRVGPIEVMGGDTIADVEAKIAQWLEQEAPEFNVAAVGGAAGILGLAYNGKTYSDPAEMTAVNVVDARACGAHSQF